MDGEVGMVSNKLWGGSMGMRRKGRNGTIRRKISEMGARSGHRDI